MNLLAWPNPKQLGDAVIVETIGPLFNHVDNLLLFGANRLLSVTILPPGASAHLFPWIQA